LISIDSFGWIERLTDGPKATAYNQIIDEALPSEIVTSSIVLYEVYRRIRQVKDEALALEAIAAICQTHVATVDQTIALEAADFSLQFGLHIADAIVYATARHLGAKLYTGDEDLGNLPDVELI